MSSGPTIGIPTQNLQSIGGVPADLPPSWVMSHRYILALVAEGGIPWMIPLLDAGAGTLREIYDRLDGIFLPGGADIDPDSYSEERHPKCETSDPARDAVELRLVSWAMEDHKPVLGICRGVQIMNLAAGGTLYQDLAEQFPGSLKHDYYPFGGKYSREHLAHEVTVHPGSRLAAIFGEGKLPVNSMHHQGIHALGDALVATAHAPDGLIEAAESPEGHWMVGVQWHPEALAERDHLTRRLFGEFVAASRSHKQERTTGLAAR
ncbi:MAG TPA: gamma-glutamyl-gamma-aminobutyrate hydrolase family protein [Gemmatimonadaceae bacterium]|nr:gamma-glutamyl-gamma-aminobutyrate hydrolase family protein [Gemmatimonadaceae bacterium]